MFIVKIDIVQGEALEVDGLGKKGGEYGRSDESMIGGSCVVPGSSNREFLEGRNGGERLEEEIERTSGRNVDLVSGEMVVLNGTKVELWERHESQMPVVGKSSGESAHIFVVGRNLNVLLDSNAFKIRN